MEENLITPQNVEEEVIFVPRIDEDLIDTVGVLSEMQNYSMAMSQIPEAHRHTKGKGIVVAVIDTGGPDHFDLLENLLPAFNTSPTPPAFDKHGHGTHVAGIIAAADNGVGVIGVAPEAKVLPIKALTDRGGAGWHAVEAAVRYATAMRVDIINMSLGAPVEPPVTLHEAIRAAHDQGIIIVCAAGNDGGEYIYWPAAYDEVIAVAAVGQDGQIAGFSNRDERLDAAAPGVQIYSTHLNQSYAYLDGTSQAAPFISGVCALVLSYLRQRPELPQVTCAKDMIAILDRLTGDQHRLTVKGHSFGIPEFCNARWLAGEGDAAADAVVLAVSLEDEAAAAGADSADDGVFDNVFDGNGGNGASVEGEGGNLVYNLDDASYLTPSPESGRQGLE